LNKSPSRVEIKESSPQQKTREKPVGKHTLRSFLILLLLSRAAFALEGKPGSSQEEYERSIESVVRNKAFYKAGIFEVSGTAGVMPYDSLINHYMLGGRLAWHLSDHFGWEIIDAQITFPTVTGFTNDLVSAKGISNLQTQRLRGMFATNLIISPVYGKIRLLGRGVLHLDVYLVVGGGLAKNETLRVSTSAIGGAPTETDMRSGMDPMFDFGLGFKFFLTKSFGLVFDLRDYVVYSELYGSKTLKSNFSVFGGISFYLPNF